MFILIKKIFYIGSFFLSSLVSTTPLSCISLKNQECKVRPKIADINSNHSHHQLQDLLPRRTS